MSNLSALKNLRTQFVLFFRKDKSLDYENIAVKIKNKVNLNFVSPSQYTNIPEALPNEIPRLEMRTHDNTYQISVSISTISLTYNRSIENLDNEYPNLINLFCSLAEIVLEFGLINRIGYVTNQFLPCTNPSDFITKKIANKDFANAFEASFRIVLKSKYDERLYNESFSFEQGEKVEQGKNSETIVLITRDINTPQNDNLNLNPAMIREFIERTYRTLGKDRIEAVFGV